MSPEQQRIAIAEACGWTGFNPDNIPDCLQYTAKAPSGKWGLIPDYLNDLNAMHEAMSVLDYDQADEFDDHLCDICKRANDMEDNPTPWRFAVTNATAAQRAEAFLRTLNLWKE